ncbi:hypothetical protein [Salinibacter ruber]|uniref:Uncharacterized protein n=1 Tax=Salinibacter ruber TaxID=146919 RepID=A0A9X2UNW2_9BACT|nr:hypothetical protein [Salinibacter ruber]MCS4038025.1 hypothetical protein [Salinibacter ruber]
MKLSFGNTLVNQGLFFFLRDGLLVPWRRKRAFLRGSARVLLSRRLEGVPFGDGLVEPGPGLADGLLRCSPAVELEVGPDPTTRKSGDEIGNAAGPDADIGELLGEVLLLGWKVAKVSQ